MLELLTLLCSLVCSTDSAELVFAGDAMQHQRQIDAARQSDGSLDYGAYFTSLTPYISSADYAVVNLEAPLGGAPYSGYPMFCAHDNYVTALTDAGFDLILSANNHILDRRDRGLVRTIDTFERLGVPWLGIYRDADHRRSVLPFIRDINGFRIAFLNYTYGTNGITKRTPVAIDYIDKELIAADVAAAREAGAEMIAVCIHWGDEYKLVQNAAQERMADWLDSLGVEMIIGGHPHVIQPMMLEQSPHTGRPVLKVYSLGNFISAMRTADTRGGAMVRVRLGRDLDGKAVIKGATCRLVMTEQPGEGHRNFRLWPAESDSITGITRQHRDAFVRNATRVFTRYNRNIPLDTLPVATYRRNVPIDILPATTYIRTASLDTICIR